MSTAAIALGEGGLADLPQIMAVMDDSFDARFGEAWTAAQCAALLPMPGVWLSLARDQSGALGFALSRIVVDEAELLLLAVRKDAQRRGIGKMLLDRFVRRARIRGAERLHLEVRDGNPAVQMYRQAGFAPVGRRRNYYRGSDGHQYDALTLACEL